MKQNTHLLAHSRMVSGAGMMPSDSPSSRWISRSPCLARGSDRLQLQLRLGQEDS